MPGCLPLVYCGCGAGVAALLSSESAKPDAATGKKISLGQSIARQIDSIAVGSDKDCAAINGLIGILWPRINRFLQQVLEEEIIPSIDEALPKALRGCLRVERLSLGRFTPKLRDFEVRQRSDEAVVLDLQVDVAADLDIRLLAGTVPVGVRSFSLRGALTVCLRPAIAQPPFFGGVEIYFVNPPELDIDFTGAADVADWRLVRGVVRQTIMTSIEDALVLPSRVAVPLQQDSDVDEISFKHPEPIGVLRLLLKSGHDLRGDDFVFNGGRTSDPYVKAELGRQRWRSATVKKTTSPVWARGNIIDFLVYDKRQRVELKVFDEDALSEDNLLGEARGVFVERFITMAAPTDVALPLSGAKGARAGSLTVATRWFHLTHSVPVQGISQAVARGPSQLVLHARIEDAVGLPADACAPFTVRVGVVARDQVYSACSTRSTDAAVKTRASQQVRNLCLHLAQKHMRADEIAAIAGLSAREVQMILSEDRDPAAAKEFARSAATTHPAFRQILCVLLPWTPDVRDGAHVQLEVVDRNNRRVGEQIRRRVDQVAWEGLVAGPFQLLPGAVLHAKLSTRWLHVPT